MPAAARDLHPAPPQPVDRKYALGIWAMMVLGVVFVFSASFPRVGRPDEAGNAGNPFLLLYARLSDLAVALPLMILFTLARPEAIRRWAKVMLGVTILLMCAVFIPGLGVERNGAQRWLEIPPLPRFQPSEFAKVAFIAFLALVLAGKDEGKHSERRAWITVAGTTAVMVLLLMLQSDQGMATIFVLIALAMAFLAGADLRWLGGIAALLFAAFLGFARMEPYRWARITGFLHPESDPDDTTYQIIRMLIALARGGFSGRFLGLSPDKWNMLPEPHTDSIFSVIGGELGLLGGVALLAALAWLTRQALDIARRSNSVYGFHLAAGCAAALGIQSMLHIAVNTSSVPCTGLTLPFISHGGSSLISAAVMAGMVLSVSRYARPDPGRK